MSKTSVSTPGANPEKAPNDTSPGFDGTIAEKFNRAVAELPPKDNPATGAAETAEKFLRSLTPEERKRFEQYVYSQTADVSTYGTVDKDLTEQLNYEIRRRGMLDPQCTGGRDITVHVLNNPGTAEGLMGPAIVNDQHVIFPRKILARTPAGQEDSILAVVGHEIEHGRKQHGLNLALKKAILGSVFPERKAVATSNEISREYEKTADWAGSSTPCGVPGGLREFFLNHPDTQNSVQGRTHPYTIDRIRADPGPGPEAGKNNKEDPGKQSMEELRRQALQAEGEEQKLHVEGISAGAVTVDMNRAPLSPQQMVNLDRLALLGGRVRFTINDGVFKEPIERELRVTERGDYYPLHVNGEIKLITVIQPLKEMPTDPTSLQYERETLQGRITSSIGTDPKSGKPRRELSFEPRKPSQGKEVIHLSGLTPEERALLGAFNHISHESRPEGQRPRQPVSWDDL